VHIYLSPHFDDVCFSLGNLASRLGGHLVNLFTRSRYVGAKMALPTGEQERIEVVTRLRNQEDQLFARAARLVRHDLGLWEPAQMGWGSFDVANLDVEIAALSARLLPFLGSILNSRAAPDTAHLYCPMGIGGHRNHLSTLVVVRQAYNALRGRCTLFLYEDLHYASVHQARQKGLGRIARIFAGTHLSPIVLPIDPDAAQRKMRFISFYASQHPRTPQISDFTPASGMASGAHEIVWRVSQTQHAQA